MDKTQLFVIHCTDGDFTFVTSASIKGTFIEKCIRGDGFTATNQIRVCFNLDVVRQLAPLIRDGTLYQPSDKVTRAELAKLLRFLGGGVELFEHYADRLVFGTVDEFGDVRDVFEYAPSDYPRLSSGLDFKVRRENLRKMFHHLVDHEYDNFKHGSYRNPLPKEEFFENVDRFAKQEFPEGFSGYFHWAERCIGTFMNEALKKKLFDAAKEEQLKFVHGRGDSD